MYMLSVNGVWLFLMWCMEPSEVSYILECGDYGVFVNVSIIFPDPFMVIFIHCRTLQHTSNAKRILSDHTVEIFSFISA